MAGVYGCERCCHLPGKGLREGLERSEAGNRSLERLQNRWLGHVVARVVASCLGLQSSDAKQPTKEPRSTPPVVPGAAPASAKAGVGGYSHP